MTIPVRNFEAASEMFETYAQIRRRLAKGIPQPKPVKALPPPEPIKPPVAAHVEIITPKPTLTVRLCRDACAKAFGISVSEIVGPDKSNRVLVPRHCGMTLAHELTGRSLFEISRVFGDRDHTTVLNAVRKWPLKRAESEAIRACEARARQIIAERLAEGGETE